MRMTADLDSIHFTASISQAEILLKTTFDYYRSPERDKVLLCTLGYSMPRHLAAHIDEIQPTTRFEEQRNVVFDSLSSYLDFLITYP